MITKLSPAPKTLKSLPIDSDWAKALTIAIPFGALAYIVGALLEGPSGQATPLDQFVYPLLAVIMLGLEALLLLRPNSLRFVTSSICLGSALFFLTKLAYLLFFVAPEIDILHQMTETFFWIPIIYLLAFLIPKVRVGQVAAIGFTVVTLGLTLTYLAVSLMANFNWGVIYALAQLNLANTVFLCLTFAFIRLKERYTVAKNEEALANHLMRFDPLTQLPNRYSLDEKLEELLTIKASESFSLLFIDIDGFKQINDLLGHHAGDQLLRSIAERLNHQAAESDFVARLSGDEFIWITKESNPEQLNYLAQRLLDKLKDLFFLAEKTVSISASIGLSTYPTDGRSAKHLLQHADIAMYQAKRAGKNTYCVYNSKMSQALEEKRELERNLRSALINDELELHYQPIFSLRNNAIVKFEALLRWKHPSRGYVSPAQFIPLAEETGLILPIGQWVLEKACVSAQAWQKYMPDVAVAVNISPLQLGVPSFSHDVLKTLERSGLAAPQLELEVTESLVLGNLDEVTRCLSKLRNSGIRVAIDDFGTGYSSLAYLQNLPVDTLKIDQSFIRKLASPLEEPHFAIALIEAMIGLSKHLELTVVAEGIETREQLDALRNAGCHLGQGYFFSKPVHPDELSQFFHPTESTYNPKPATLN